MKEKFLNIFTYYVLDTFDQKDSSLLCDSRDESQSPEPQLRQPWGVVLLFKQLIQPEAPRFPVP